MTEKELLLKMAVPIEQMTAEQKVQYATIEKQFTELLSTYGKEVEGKLKKALEELPPPADNSADVVDLKETLTKLQDAVTKIQEGLESVNSAQEDFAKLIPTPEVAKSHIPRREFYKEAIKEAIKEKINTIADLHSTGQSVKITKEVGTISTANLTDGNGNPTYVHYSPIDPGVTRPQQRKAYLRDLITVNPISSGHARWTEAVAGEGGAGATAEGTRKNEKDQDYITNTAPVQKITAFSKVDEEMLDDIEFAAQDIADDLTESVLLKEDAAIYGGNGTPPEFKGLTTYAPSFTVTNSVNSEFYHAIPFANRRDVLRTAVAIIAKNNFSATAILLNPSDSALIDMQKNSHGSYINIMSSDGVTSQVPVIENTGVAVGTYLIGDLSKSNYRIRKELTLVVDRCESDLLENKFTFLVELRGVHYVKSNHLNAFIKGTFATDISAINGTAPIQEVNIANTAPIEVAIDGDVAMVNGSTPLSVNSASVGDVKIVNGSTPLTVGSTIVGPLGANGGVSTEEFS